MNRCLNILYLRNSPWSPKLLNVCHSASLTLSNNYARSPSCWNQSPFDGPTSRMSIDEVEFVSDDSRIAQVCRHSEASGAGVECVVSGNTSDAKQLSDYLIKSM